MILYTYDFSIPFEISDDDFYIASNHKWTLSGKYIRNTRGIYLHRLLMSCPKGFEVDHIDRDPLNNKRDNLRIVTRSENNKNKSKYNKYKNKSTGIYGIDTVPSNRRRKPYYFRVRIQGLRDNKFSSLIKAIKYRNKFLKQHPEILSRLEEIYNYI